MSWRYKVVIILALFLISMTTMVYISMQQTNDMVDANYYERELKYQQIINAKNNFSKLSDTVTIYSNHQYVELNFPEESTTRLDSGKIEFIRLSNSKHDVVVQMKADNGRRYQLPATSFSKGWYKVRMEWSNNNEPYYNEKNFKVK